MAVGIGSRFGTGIKQLATVDSSNHIIMDYSIHDAIEAGFNKIIFRLSALVSIPQDIGHPTIATKSRSKMAPLKGLRLKR